MTRKLGRLLVVALVVAAVVAPMSVASADIGEHLECNGIVYDPANPNHVMYPEATIQVREYYNAWEVWNYRHWGDGAPTHIDNYIVFDMEDYFTGAPDVAHGGAFVFFWNDLLWDDPAIDDDWFVRIEGTQYDDIICGGPENDVLLGRGGDDIIFGGSFVPSAGNDDQDVVRGGAGDDVLMGGWGYDGVSGGTGDDEVYGGFPEELYPGLDEMGPYPYASPDDSPPSFGNELFAGAGDDLVVSGLTGADLGHAGTGNDTMSAELNDDGVEFYGGAGNDTIVGSDSDDYLDGTTGNDTIWGLEGDDAIFGGAGDDVLYAHSPGTSALDALYDTGLYDTNDGDELFGNGGNDQLWGGLGQELVLFGGPGNDVIPVGKIASAGDPCPALDTIPAGGVAGCLGGPGADTMTASPGGGPMYGGKGDDTLQGGAAIDSLYGNAGDDLIYGGANDDHIEGGAGYDDILGEAGLDTILGGSEGDWIDAGSGNDDVYGNTGNDVLVSGEGDDLLVGGDGVDTLDARGNTTNAIMYGADLSNVLPDPRNPTGAGASKDDDVDTFYGGTGDNSYLGYCQDLDVAHLKPGSLTDPIGNYLYRIAFYDGALPTLIVVTCP